ncbi:MAG: halocarboxylic acid dehydrogenase DehI family protein [Candidatus Aquicultorales bacterium]
MKLVNDADANPEISAVFSEIRESLSIPWTPALFQALAAYPEYLNLAWNTIKPAVMTDEFRSDAFGIREVAEGSVQANHKPKRTLADAAVLDLEDDLDDIREVLHVFRFGDPKLSIIASALNRSFMGERVGSADQGTPAEETNEERFVRSVRIEMVEEDQAPAQVRAVFDDIKATFETPVLNSDYKALANWPNFLQMAWEDLKDQLDEAWCEQVYTELKNLSNVLAGELTVGVGLDKSRLMSQGVPEEYIDPIGEALDLFANNLPGLISNVSHFYLTLNDIVESDMGLKAA